MTEQDEAESLVQKVRRETLAEVWTALNEERKDRLRRRHVHIARGFALALELLEKKFIDVIEARQKVRGK